MRIWMALSLLALAACRAPGADGPATEPELEVPETWMTGEVEAASAEPWWTLFGDEELVLLIAEALEHNRDLAASVARLEGAAAQARIAGADLRPAMGLSGSAARSQQVFVGLPIPGGPDVLKSRSSSYGVSLNVSWEIDLWGRMSAARDSALAEVAASAAEHRAAALSIAAQTAKGWLAWQAARLQEDLAARTVASLERSTELVRNRFESGRASSLDIHRTQGDLASAQALLELRAEAGERARRQVEILLGRHPSGTLEGRPHLPEVPALPSAGVPAELLRRRPDLLAAEARLKAADARAWEARARLWPQLTLSASAGRTAGDASDLTHPDFDVWSILAGLSQPILQGGRLEAGVDLADARAREAAATYASSALRAFLEVETALAVEGALVRREALQGRASEEAHTARTLAEDRYAAGRIDLDTLLDAERRALGSESDLLAARLQRLEARVDLHLALGGGLPPEAEPPEGADG